MSSLSERDASRRDTVAFLICLLLAVIARAAPQASTDAVASGLRQTVLVPFLVLQQQTEILRNRRAQFARLVGQRDSATMLVNLIGPLRAENNRLRALLGLTNRVEGRFVAAEVLHQATLGVGTTLLLTAGDRDGIRQFDAVVAPEGLVGHIWTVDRETSVAVAWTHPEFRASGETTEAQGTVVGLVEPHITSRGTTFLRLREVAHLANVPPGAEVATSGLGIYPRGIPIGWVREMIEEREGWSKTYLVEPAVHPAAVSHVLILLGETRDLEETFVPQP